MSPLSFKRSTEILRLQLSSFRSADVKLLLDSNLKAFALKFITIPVSETMLQTASSNTGILEAETSGASGKQSVVTEDIASFPLPALQLSPRPRKSTLYEIGNDTEMNTQATVSYPPSSIAHSGAGAPRSEAQIREFRRKSNIHFAALCWFMFSEGWNDGTPGPLLPVIQQSYHVWAAICGFIMAESHETNIF